MTADDQYFPGFGIAFVLIDMMPEAGRHAELREIRGSQPGGTLPNTQNKPENRNKQYLCIANLKTAIPQSES